MNCMYCGKLLTKKQIAMIKAKKRDIYFCSKECAYSSPLRKEKISESSKGKKLSEEHKRKISKKISEIMIGNKYGSRNKGRKLSEEHKKSISMSNMGHEVKKETREKLSFSHSGKTIPKEIRIKMNQDKKGKPRSQEIKKKISNSNKGKNHGVKGRKLSDEHKRKISHTERLTVLKKLEERLKNGEQLIPNWNPRACDYFEKFDLENNTQGQHARNGGEHHIKELGYWVDYINHDLKLIMEYDEDYHFTKTQIEKDIRRQREIEELYSDYKFVRIQAEV